MNLQDYISGGYFLSRWAGVHDCTNIELRRVTMANDHSQRVFFPERWALSWCRESRETRVANAALFGISERGLGKVIAWADKSFEREFGAFSAFFTLDSARAAARTYLRNASDVELWGVGLHQSLVASYCEESKPPDSLPGCAPNGAGGTHVAVCRRTARLEGAGELVGYELLIDDMGTLNSPEARHLDETAMFRATGVIPNGTGLIDSFDEALACARYLDAHADEMPHGLEGWRPWLIVRYPLR